MNYATAPLRITFGGVMRISPEFRIRGVIGTPPRLSHAQELNVLRPSSLARRRRVRGSHKDPAVTHARGSREVPAVTLPHNKIR